MEKNLFLNIIYIWLNYPVNFTLTCVYKKHVETQHQKEPRMHQSPRLQEGEGRARLRQRVSANKWKKGRAPELRFQTHCSVGAAKEEREDCPHSLTKV